MGYSNGRTVTHISFATTNNLATGTPTLLTIAGGVTVDLGSGGYVAYAGFRVSTVSGPGGTPALQLQISKGTGRTTTPSWVAAATFSYDPTTGGSGTNGALAVDDWVIVRPVSSLIAAGTNGYDFPRFESGDAIRLIHSAAATGTLTGAGFIVVQYDR